MSNLKLFEKIESPLEQYFTEKKKYTFLVGAGISMDAPSSLPSAVKIVRSLINLCAPEEEIQNSKNRCVWLNTQRKNSVLARCEYP